ncbi:unnamed protein product [Xylocopa violacea]|uniref:Odorant receptor n=1 Tax=Xylocopa violacea TaxID=135666 RepID=A0ABP1NAN8_XYLVO
MAAVRERCWQLPSVDRGLLGCLSEQKRAADSATMNKEIEYTSRYQNVRYKADTEYVVRVAKILLTPVGIWPRNDSFLDNVKMFVQTGTMFSLMCFLLIPHAIYTYFDCENLSRYMKVIAAQVFSLLAIIKFCVIIINRRKVMVCLTEMEAQYRDVACEDDRLVMVNCARIGRSFTKLYLGLCYGGALPYHVILPLLSEKVVKQDNSTQLPLPYLSDYVFFVIEDSPIYEMTFALQILISSIILSANCGTYSLIVAITMHCCSLFEVTNKRIEMLLRRKQRDLHDRLVKIVRYHLKAIEYSTMVEQTLSIVFLSDIVGCTLVICFLEFGVIEWEDRKTLNTVTYFVLMTAILVNVFIICFIGDRLKQQSEKVGETLYSVPWYNFPEGVAKNIRTIILRTSHPTSLTGAKLFNVSLQAFCDVFKTSAAYLNFFRAMTT